MANLDDRKINLRWLLSHPRDSKDGVHFNLLVGNYKYMMLNDNLVRYDAKTYEDRSKQRWYGSSSSFHYTFMFSADDLTAVSEICTSTNMALIHRHKSDEVNLFSKIKLKFFPKHVIPFDVKIKHNYLVDSYEDLISSINMFRDQGEEKDMDKFFNYKKAK